MHTGTARAKWLRCRSCLGTASWPQLGTAFPITQTESRTCFNHCTFSIIRHYATSFETYMHLAFVTKHDLTLYAMQMYSLSFVPPHTGGATPPHGTCRRPYNLCVWKQACFLSWFGPCSHFGVTGPWWKTACISQPGMSRGACWMCTCTKEGMHNLFLCKCRLEKWEVQSLTARRKDRM